MDIIHTVNEKRKKFDALTPVTVSSTEAKELHIASSAERSGWSLMARVIDWVKSKKVFGIHHNAEKNWDINVKPSSVRSIIGHGDKGKRIALIETVPTLIRDGVYLDEILKNNQGLKTHVFAGKANIDGISYAVSFAVREDSNGKRYYNHSLISIEALDRIDDQAPSPMPDQKRVTVSSFRPDGEDVGELSLSNILKKHLGVNT